MITPQALARALPALTLILAGSGCSIGPTYHGSGVLAEELRPLDDFGAVSLAGHFEAEVRVGGEPEITVHGDDNLLDHVLTEVDDGVLEVRMESGSYRTKHDIRVEIVAPRLRSVSLSGSGGIVVHGVDDESFSASIAGSGDIEAEGRTERLQASIAGSGDLDLLALESEQVSISISGSGDARVHANDSLDISISGSGDVTYRGRPRISQRVSGSGSVRAD